MLIFIAKSYESRHFMTEGLEAIAENARRLLEDAELLFSSGSFATSAAIAIIAIEEAGKHYMLKWDFEGDTSHKAGLASKGRKAHQEKQSVLGSFYLAEVAVETIREYLRKIGFEGDDRSVKEFSSALHYLRSDPEYGPKVAEVEEKVITLVAQRMAESEHGNFMHDAMQGNIQAIKHCGLYVDLATSGKVVSGPNRIQEQDARLWLLHARRAIALMSHPEVL